MQRSLLTNRYTSGRGAVYQPEYLSKPYKYDKPSKIVNLHRCTKCKHWCKVIWLEQGMGLFFEASSCCAANMTFERYEQKNNNNQV